MKLSILISFLIAFHSICIGAEAVHFRAKTEDEAGKALPNIPIRVSFKGEGVSNSEGEVDIPLSSDLSPGDEVEIQVLSTDWIIKNCYGNRLVLPRGASSFVHLVLVPKGSLSLLTDATLRKLVAESSSVQALPSHSIANATV